jgi:hypothetical protein
MRHRKSGLYLIEKSMNPHTMTQLTSEMISACVKKRGDHECSDGLRNYLRAEGRDPEAFEIEAWVRSGIGGVEHQIEAMRQFRDAVR